MVAMADRLTAAGVTRKEAEVLESLGEHLTNAEIAARMYVSERTVESHVSSLLRKLHATNRRELGTLARGAGATSLSNPEPSGPTGTITFLFTDIEDSTVLWERFPRLMPVVLARHDEVVSTAIEGHRGRIFSTAGDGFAAAFASASDGVAAAVDAQRALGSGSWPGEVSIRVRMGLHSGTATEHSGSYVGGAVNRAARIAAAGRGGHVLLSAASAALAADDGWTLVDLGWHRLKGLERPERIVRVDAADFPVVGLALRASRERVGNLPRPPTGMIGRHDELKRLTAALGTNRLVTITGPGGAGKTRLAIAAADVMSREFADGTWLVELGELHDAADVAPAVATTLALQPASGADRATSTVTALADHHALLVLDNCEHVIDGLVQLVAQLESRCDRVVVLATSREALGLDRELRFTLHPLGYGTTTCPTRPSSPVNGPGACSGAFNHPTWTSRSSTRSADGSTVSHWRSSWPRPG